MDQERQLRKLMQVFLEENKKLNLSAYREKDTCWVGNVLDSIVGIRDAEFGKGERVVEVGGMGGAESRGSPLRIVDIGTGGGFPLLPLAILFPHAEFTGLDATRKKVDAVQRIIDQLTLTNVRLLLGRAEELGHDSMYREQYNVVLSRAVAPLATLLEFMSPFAKPKGRLIVWKTLSIDDEMQASLNARLTLRTRLMDRIEYALPGDWGKRQLLIFEKTGVLSPEYPRGVGIPKKEPL